MSEAYSSEAASSHDALIGGREESFLPAAFPTVDDPLNEILMAITESDESLMGLDLDRVTALFEAGRIKVDNYKNVLDRLEMLASHFKARKDEFATAQRTAQTAWDRLRKHMAMTLKQNGFDRFTGNEYQVRLQASTPAVEIKGEPDAKTKARFPNFVRAKYEWDKEAIRDALQKELAHLQALQEKAEEGIIIEPAPGSIATWATLKRSWHPVFTPNKQGLLNGKRSNKK